MMMTRLTLPCTLPPFVRDGPPRACSVPLPTAHALHAMPDTDDGDYIDLDTAPDAPTHPTRDYVVHQFTTRARLIDSGLGPQLDIGANVSVTNEPSLLSDFRWIDPIPLNTADSSGVIQCTGEGYFPLRFSGWFYPPHPYVLLPGCLGNACLPRPDLLPLPR